MVKSKKKLIILLSLGVFIVFYAVYLGYVHYLTHKLEFSFSKMVSADNSLKFLHYAYQGEMPEDFRSKLYDIQVWNEEAIHDITRNYTEPMRIDVSADVVDGKTIFRYSGNVTTKDGKQVDYLNEEVFDFILVPNEKLPKLG